MLCCGQLGMWGQGGTHCFYNTSNVINNKKKQRENSAEKTVACPLKAG